MPVGAEPGELLLRREGDSDIDREVTESCGDVRLGRSGDPPDRIGIVDANSRHDHVPCWFATAPEELPPPDERITPPAPAADDPLTRIAEVQAREPADPRWAALAEARLRDLARSLGAAALVERVLCSGTLCRVELTHGPGALPSKSLDAFVSGASELMAQAMIQPDEAGGKTTLVFARAGSTLPAAEGGGG